MTMRTIDLTGVPVTARLDEYFGLWAIEEMRFAAMFNRVSRMDLRLHVQQALAAGPVKRDKQQPASGDIGGDPAQGKIALIQITGTLMKQVAGGSLSQGGSSLVELRNLVRQAAAGDYKAILLLVDSPGGTVAGTPDLAETITAAAKIKPVYAFIEDMAASAAYYAISGATKIFANGNSAVIGSIGTMAVVYDESGAAAMQGVKAHLFKTGPLKGAGVRGTEITPAIAASYQKLVDETQTHFSAAVKAGRGLSDVQMKTVLQGGVFLSAEAEKMGLIDGIMSFDQTLAALETAAMNQRSPGVQLQNEKTGADLLSISPGRPEAGITKEVLAMGETNTTASASQVAQGPKPASLAELKTALPKSTAEFREQCIEQGRTMEQALAAHNEIVQAQLESAQSQLEAAKAGGKTIGVKPLNTGAKGAAGAGDAEATGDFAELVSAYMATRPTMERREAIKAMAKKHPEAHAAYVANSPKAAPPVQKRTA